MVAFVENVTLIDMSYIFDQINLLIIIIFVISVIIDFYPQDIEFHQVIKN
jgi:hypothetical protein